MNWEALGAIEEIVGAVAVVVTLDNSGGVRGKAR